MSLGEREQQFYDLAAREVAERTVVRGIMAKAFSDAGGDERKAVALYIKYRVKNLRKNRHESKATKAATVRTCPTCGADYQPADYRPDAEWFCSACNEALPKETI
jgi:hypothetical protein